MSLIVLAAPLAVPVWAHHSVSATFGMTTLVSVAGTVARIEWRNPHVVIHIRVNTINGEEPRHVEMAGPRAVERRGLHSADIRIGDDIAVQAWEPKPGSARQGWLSGTTLTLPDGRRFDVSDSLWERSIR